MADMSDITITRAEVKCANCPDKTIVLVDVPLGWCIGWLTEHVDVHNLFAGHPPALARDTADVRETSADF